MKSTEKPAPKNAYIRDQLAWGEMSKKMKKTVRKVLPDSDKDGVPNGFDCRPRNPKKQESFLSADAKYANSKSHVDINKKQLGKGSNGGVYQVKGNPNMVVKLSEGDYTGTLYEEADFYKKHGKEPLFIPTKAVSVGRDKQYGLLRPKVKDVLDPQHGLRDKEAFTDSRLKTLYNKLVTLSSRGYVLDDGLQLGIDRAGRMLQFDLGLCETASPEYAFERNDQMWRDLLKRVGKSSKFGHLTPSKKSATASNKKTQSISQKHKSVERKISSSGAVIYVDPKFHFHPKHKEIYQKVEKALKDFPEIKAVALGAFYPKSGDQWESKSNMAIAGHANIDDSNCGTIEFNMTMTPTYNTIYHELYHVIQHGRKSTKQKSDMTKEIEATILGQARLPKSKVETGYMAYFTTVPKSKVTEYAKLAASEKAKGNKKYMDVVTKKIHSDYVKDTKANKANSNKWESGKTTDPKHSAKFSEIRNGKNFAKGYTPSAVKKYLKTNIRKSQQPSKKLIDPKIGLGGYLYTKDDLIKVPSWMKSSNKSVTKSVNQTKATSKSKSKSALKTPPKRATPKRRSTKKLTTKRR